MNDQPTPIRILLVDDQPLFRRAIATLIDAQPDLEVVGQGSNGLEGVEMAHQLLPDVLLMDVEMPVMNGVEAAGRVLEDLPGTKVILLTVSEDDEYLLPAVRQGVHGYLLKDMHPDELFETFRLGKSSDPKPLPLSEQGEKNWAAAKAKAKAAAASASPAPAASATPVVPGTTPSATPTR
ncbi:response regulator [Luteococcus japonicus]|uniref:DNA-binding response regulator, LuxR family n=1 Tax=Luteococcus japonicus LSP_Lj1 TaxID=1255658 RepID=A0A1R4KBT2_9ACTN|nr:response regulator transcription factor [Luteococcus japonicus]SJN41776.1 DNA-binding response regulator, LuxR family [Luteococcus japonicus LSP_Lj1]